MRCSQWVCRNIQLQRQFYPHHNNNVKSILDSVYYRYLPTRKHAFCKSYQYRGDCFTRTCVPLFSTIRFLREKKNEINKICFMFCVVQNYFQKVKKKAGLSMISHGCTSSSRDKLIWKFLSKYRIKLFSFVFEVMIIFLIIPLKLNNLYF